MIYKNLDIIGKTVDKKEEIITELIKERHQR